MKKEQNAAITSVLNKVTSHVNTLLTLATDVAQTDPEVAQELRRAAEAIDLISLRFDRAKALARVREIDELLEDSAATALSPTVIAPAPKTKPKSGSTVKFDDSTVRLGDKTKLTTSSPKLNGIGTDHDDSVRFSG